MLKLLFVAAICVAMIAVIVLLIRYFHNAHALEGRLGKTERDRVITRHARANVRAVETMLARHAREGGGRDPRRKGA